MTKCRKALSLLLTILMVFSLFPMMVSADETGTGSTEPVWPDEGSIKLDKNANAVEGAENLWEIVLSIQGKNYKTTSDVVLVIDNSNSMYTKKSYNSYVEGENSRMHYTKIAARAFVDALLTPDSSARIALVVYGTDLRSFTDFYDNTQVAEIKTKIDGIKPESNNNNGGTNQQAGIHVAQELLSSEASTGKLKNIVILSDGEATYSYPFVGGKAAIDCGQFIGHWFSGNPQVTNWPTTATPDYTTIIGSGNSFELDGNIIWNCTCEHNRTTQKLYGSFYYDSNGNLVCSNDEKSSDNGVATIWEANLAKAAGTTIFSVALQAGTDGENTLKACATDASSGYYAIGENDNVAEKLTSAFTAIAGSIAIAASQGSVTDPMGDMVQLAFSGTAPVITTDEAVYNAGNADVYISQGNATFENGTIHWNVGDVREGVNPTMRYKITIIPDEKINTGDVLEANGRTTFNYKNYKDEETTAEFPIPEITVGGGNIRVHYYMVNGNGQPINESGVVVDSPSLAKQVKEAEYLSVNGSTGLSYNTPYTVEKENIADYTYYGSYNLNNGALTEGNAATVTLTVANSNQHVWFAYTQGFNVVHVQNGVGIRTDAYTIGQEVAGIYEEGLFNLTAAVTDGYLYGGTFTFERDNYTTVHHEFTGNNAKNPMSFHPTAGETYYIWEVNKDYLRPRSVSGARTTSAGTDVVGFFIMTPIDREYYSEVGFTVNDKDVLKANQVAEWYVTNGKTTTNLSNLVRTVVYKEFQILKTNNQYDTYTVGRFSTSSKISAGYLACVSLDKTAYWNNAGDEITFVPYWITMDGVKVTNMTRTCKYLGAGKNDDAHRMIGMIAENDATSITYVNTIQTQNVEPLMVMAAYCGGNTVDSNPEQPIEPVQPTEPEVPEKDTVTVTVVDYDTKYVLELQSGDVTEYIKYTGEKNCLFAGWYTDEAYTNPADFTYVTEDITIFAKYVSDSYLRLSYDEKRSYSNWKRTLTLSTTAPEDDFREIGFLVNGEMCIAKDKKSFGYGERFNDQYDSSYNFVYAFGFGFGYPAFGEKPVDLERTLTYALSVTRGETYEITPYWVTMDGTTVYGESRTLNVQRYGVNG